MPQPKVTRDTSIPSSLISDKTKISVINLGCVRNLVDSQIILGRLAQKKYRIVELNQCDVAIVNTCSFVDDAKKESVDVILDLINLKKKGTIKKIIVAGCLSQRYGQKLVSELREVDAFVGSLKIDAARNDPEVSLTPSHYAYVKICESCYNQCSFCAIPKIKGKFASRKSERIIDQIKELNKRGVKEINLIGQDITAYGMDLYKKKSLSGLLGKIVRVSGNIEWIRLLYTFPAHMSDDLINVIADHPKICRYVDMPVQHINDRILKRMKRNLDKKSTVQLIEKLKKRIPGVSLRTTMIVGFPGESDTDFEELMEFVKATRFEWLGVFIYSPQEGTQASGWKNQIPEKIKKQRYHRLMRLQKKISSECQKTFLSKKIKVLIDEKPKTEENVYIARSEFDAPDVDGVVFVHSPKALEIGEFVNVTVTDTNEYDLIGTLS